MYDDSFLLVHNPNLPKQQGNNRNVDPMFTLGSMSFGMIILTDVLCYIQWMTRHIHKLSKLSPNGRWKISMNVPLKLRDAVESKSGELKSFVVSKCLLWKTLNQNGKGGRRRPSRARLIQWASCTVMGTLTPIPLSQTDLPSSLQEVNVTPSQPGKKKPGEKSLEEIFRVIQLGKSFLYWWPGSSWELSPP